MMRLTEMNRRALARLVIGAAGAVALPQSLTAAEDASSDKKILTISGRIREGHGSVTYTRPALEALGMHGFTTKTPWYDAPVTFEGVPMATLMQKVGAAGDHVTAIALNDYTTDIPMADFSRFGVILALKRDGNYMPVRDKGPLFIVYPYDSNPVLRSSTYTSRSAWQVSQLIVK